MATPLIERRPCEDEAGIKFKGHGVSTLPCRHHCSHSPDHTPPAPCLDMVFNR